MEDNSIDLIATDPPYYKVKGEYWDNQWDTAQGFIDWIGELCQEWQRILKPNGSVYVFASPKMSARVEVKVGEWFNVLDGIVWAKPEPTSDINYGAGNGGRVSKEGLRHYYQNTERIIFAEHFNSDNMAKGEAGYNQKCDELRGFVFEPIVNYLREERSKAGLRNDEIDALCGWRTTAFHFFAMSGSNFCLPTSENYHKLQALFNRHLNGSGPKYLRREYEDLRREYEDLRREYEDLRRPFNATADEPYTDVWTFKTVSDHPGKHPAQKPLGLMRHIIGVSSRPDAVVFDPFMGSGTTGVACIAEGRDFIGIELDKKYFERAKDRMRQKAFPGF